MRKTDIPADLGVEPPIAATTGTARKSPLKRHSPPLPPPIANRPLAANYSPCRQRRRASPPPAPRHSQQAKPPARRLDWRSQATASLLKSLPWKGSSGDFSAPEFFGEDHNALHHARRSALAPKTRPAPSPSRTRPFTSDPNTPVHGLTWPALPWQGPTETLGSSHLDEDGGRNPFSQFLHFRAGRPTGLARGSGTY